MSVIAGARSDPAVLRRAIAAGFVGTVIEWYDFIIFGTVSVIAFSKVFYPEQTPFIALLLSLGTFAVGFVARPVGGIFFGYLGDRIGRRYTLIVTLTVMGIATLLIGLLPGYQSIGAAAPTLLIILRLLQGFSLGGEFGGVATLLIEHAPKDRRGAVGGWAQAGGFVGPLLGTGVILILRATLSDAELVSWGWRLPFLLSILLILVSAYIRTHVTESPEFERARAEKELSKQPIRSVLMEYPKEIFCVFGMHAGNAILFYTGLIFAVAYITRNVGLSQNKALWANAVFLLAAAIACILVARLSDRVGRKPIYLTGTILGMVMAFPLFWLLDTGSLPTSASCSRPSSATSVCRWAIRRRPYSSERRRRSSGCSSLNRPAAAPGASRYISSQFSCWRRYPCSSPARPCIGISDGSTKSETSQSQPRLERKGRRFSRAA